VAGWQEGSAAAAAAGLPAAVVSALSAYRPAATHARCPPHLLHAQGQLEELDTADMEWNLKHCTLRTVCGGEAAVHIVRWRTPPGLAPCAIGDGREVAIKVYHKPDGPGFLKLNNTWDMQQEGGRARGAGNPKAALC